MSAIKKRVLVTGSSRGIGAACAIKLAQAGFAITLHSRTDGADIAEVQSKMQSMGATVDRLKFDVSKREETAAVLTTYVEENGGFWGVVCNAGITEDAAFPAMTGQQWDSVIHTNLDSFYNVLQPLTMPMIRLRDGGRIVVLTSVSGVVGNRGQTNYSASKAGLIGASKSLAIELAKRNITVNCVAPGVIVTDMTNDEVFERAKEMIPMQRAGTVDEIAGTVDFLCSKSAAYITRQVINVNGGMC